MKVISLTHNDLDGLGCVVAFMIKFKPQKFFFTNYYDMDDVLKELIRYKRETQSDTLVIGDLSFSDRPDILDRLCHVFKNNVFIIDHHMYPDGFFDTHVVRHVVDDTKCATALCWEHLGLDKLQDPKILSKVQNFVKLVDTWDMWRDTDENFERALYANELFTALSAKNDLVTLAKQLIAYDFSVFDNLDSFIDAYNADYVNYVKDLKKRKLIWVNKEIGLAFIFGWDYFPKLNLDLYKKGIKVAVGVKYGIFKVRINQHAGYSEQQLNKFREVLTGMQEFCHLHAFTYKTDCDTEQQIVDECKRISDTMYTVMR